MGGMSQAGWILAAGVALTAAQTPSTDKMRSNVDVVQPPSYTDLTDVNLSLMMDCYNADISPGCQINPSAVTTSPNGLRRWHPFDRDFFGDNLVKAINEAARKMLPGREDEAFVMSRGAVKFDRVVFETEPFRYINGAQVPNPPTVESWQNGVKNPNGSPDPLYWNVFVRVTLSDIPDSVARIIRSNAIPVLEEEYNGVANILIDSVWVSSDAPFIQDQLEPVVGLGHKDQKLVIPLVMGIFCMLLAPALVSWVLVKKAQQGNENEAEVAARAKQIAYSHDLLTGKKAALEALTENEESRREKQEIEMKERTRRDAHELQDPDVDWESKRLVTQPFGNEE